MQKSSHTSTTNERNPIFMEKRLISTQVQEEDIKIEKNLRPQTLDDYIGQQKAKKI